MKILARQRWFHSLAMCGAAVTWAGTGALAQSGIAGWGRQVFDSGWSSGGVVEVDAGAFHTVARRGDGTVVAFGLNLSGQCAVPSPPPGRTYVEVAGGEGHIVLRLDDGSVEAFGSSDVMDDDVTLLASQLPPHSFGYFLTSRYQGEVFPLQNSQGRLCLGGFIGRYLGPGQVQSSGAAGVLALGIDLGSMPNPLGPVAAVPGETWHFQAWYWDANPSGTSNFTDAVSIAFHWRPAPSSCRRPGSREVAPPRASSSSCTSRASSRCSGSGSMRFEVAHSP